MGEDVSAQIRTGITVILVAALITAVLNLMAVSQNILSGGLSTLETGIDQIILQEFAKYDQSKVSGTSVKAAISLYQSKEMAIIVQTKACRMAHTEYATTPDKAGGYMYGTLIVGGGNADSAGSDSSLQTDTDGSSNYRVNLKHSTGLSYFEAEYDRDAGLLQTWSDTANTQTTGKNEYILSSARFRSYLIKNASGDIIGLYFVQQD